MKLPKVDGFLKGIEISLLVLNIFAGGKWNTKEHKNSNFVANNFIFFLQQTLTNSSIFMAVDKEEIGSLGYLISSSCFIPSHFGRIDNETCLKAGSKRGKEKLAYRGSTEPSVRLLMTAM